MTKDLKSNRWKSKPLSYRASSLIIKLGGIESTLRYYQQHNTFVNLDKIGLATSNELIFHLENNLYINKLKEQNLADQTNFNSSTIDLYHNLKNKCTVRSQNALIKIEPKDPSSFVEWKNFIIIYFINDFNFMNIDNIGKKSLIELIHIKDIILENYNKVDADIHLVDQGTNSLNSTLDIYRILDKAIRIENINYIINKQLNPSLIFLCYLILIKNKNNLRNLFIKKYYFSQDNSNFNQLAKELNCSRERIRQIDDLLKKRIKNDYWPLVRNTINQYEMPNNDAGIINFDGVNWNISVNFENEELKSNIKLKKIFFDIIFSEKYIDLIKALHNTKTKYKSFNVNGLNCYLKKEIILDLNIVDFFKWIDVEIYNFEIVEFDYNLEILIKRYFKENNYKYNDTTIKTLHEAILLIKTNIALENNFLKNKINKNLKTNEIINICVDNLNATNKPASTSQLLRIISGKGILTNRIELLSILGQNNSTFQRIGSGLWHLNNNIPDKNIRGSLRDITYNLLLSSRDPLHISEIINCISKYRSISEASLIGNLKMANNNVLQLFNCYFIGLKSKKYDNKWYNIPKFLGSHLSEYELNIAKIEYPQNIAEYFSYKYGYPIVHVNYLLSKKAFFIKK
ncbi:MAG: hypothetical protein IPG21_10310 [Saprospiraceae bacterium]|nr:hypothetical protein [Candidatus Vicinibacter affinis]